MDTDIAQGPESCQMRASKYLSITHWIAVGLDERRAITHRFSTHPYRRQHRTSSRATAGLLCANLLCKVVRETQGLRCSRRREVWGQVNLRCGLTFRGVPIVTTRTRTTLSRS